MRSKKALYNIISELILQIIIVLYGFVVPKIIISTFGSSVNGLISSITQFLGYIVLLESGFGPVVKAILYKPIAKKGKSEIANILKTAENFFRTIAIIFLGYIFILAFIYPLVVKNEFEYYYTLSLVIIISISTFAEYFFGMTYKLYLQAEQKNYVISIIQIIIYMLNIIAVVVLAKLNCSLHIIKLITGIVFVLRPIIQNLYVKKKYQLDIKNADSKYKISQKWDGLAQHIASVIHSNTDITILTFFCSLTEVSVYSVYYLVVKGMRSIIQAFTSGIDALFGNMMANEEKANLSKKFDFYEIIYFIIAAILYTSTLMLIVPFVTVYTKGITDANYIRYGFGYLIVISEYIWAIRLPYSTITFAAGHFKETRNGAWVEVLTNIIISIILVHKYGIIGVAIGTIVAMTIRTIEFVYHANKFILKRSVLDSLKKIILVIIETVIVMVIIHFIPLYENVSYIFWLMNAIIIVVISCIVIIGISFIFYHETVKEIIQIIKKQLKK